MQGTQEPELSLPLKAIIYSGDRVPIGDESKGGDWLRTLEEVASWHGQTTAAPKKRKKNTRPRVLPNVTHPVRTSAPPTDPLVLVRYNRQEDDELANHWTDRI